MTYCKAYITLFTRHNQYMQASVFQTGMKETDITTLRNTIKNKKKQDIETIKKKEEYVKKRQQKDVKSTAKPSPINYNR